MDSSIEKIVSLCKRRGFIFQSSEIYGGFSAIYDYGPLGIELKNQISQLWWREMTHAHENIVGLDSGILMHPRIWEASGHVNAFNDPLIDCKHCKARFKADEFKKDSESITWKDIQCPRCGTIGSLTEPRQFNLMFKTNIGPVAEKGTEAYLRPETAQGIYVNYLLVQGAMRLKVPFGIAQIGKAFRNEIIARNFIFRTREFEQLEMQYFVKPGSDDKIFQEWKKKRMTFYVDFLDIDKSSLRFYKHGEDDIEYKFPFGWSEIEGVHNRTNFDLSQHEKFSGKKMSYFDQQKNERYLPYIIETSAGLNRMLLTVLTNAYWDDKENNRIVLKLSPKIAPIKAAICPLTKKDGLPEKAREIMDILKPKFKVIFDQQGSIGKRYYRQDEAGTPFGITIDHQTLEDNTVTIRFRDTQKQERMLTENILDILNEST